MTRSGRRLLLAALLAAALGAPAFAGDAETNADKIAQIQRDLDDMRRDLKDLRRRLTDADVKAGRSTVDLDELRERLAVLERMVVKHDDLLKGPTNRSAFSFPPAPGRAGTLRLENRWGGEATVVVNGTPYVLAPYETRTLANQPEGLFTYSVSTPQYGVIRPTVTRPLRANDTFTIYVNPPSPTVVIP
jgi:hypothetical protein